MSIQQVNLGNYANDGQGDDLRTAFEKYNVSVTDLDQTRVIGANNLGTGAPIFADKTNKNLNVRSIKAGGRPGNIVVTYSDTEVSIAGRDSILHVEEDTSPKLGGNLDLNSHLINGLGAIDITGIITADKLIGTLEGDVIIEDGTLTIRAYNTNTNNYNPLFLNGFEITGNNVQRNGISMLATHSGDSFKLSSGKDLDITSESGKINIFQPTIISEAGGIQLNVDGSITAINFNGNVTGNVTGVITGQAGSNIQGSFTGVVTGQAGSTITGNVVGNVVGNVLGNLTGNVYGNLVGTTTGTHTGPVVGPVTGRVSDISNHKIVELNDISIAEPAIGQVLKWNGNQWEPSDDLVGEAKADLVNYDFGRISSVVTNPFQLLFQSSTITFGSFTDPNPIVLDLGPMISVIPTYTLTRSGAYVTEGNIATISLTTTNVVDGTTIPYVITGAGISSGDFVSFTLSGNFIINSDVGSVILDVTNDVFIEGTEVLTLSLVGISPQKNISINVGDNTPMDGGAPDTAVFVETEDGGAPAVDQAIIYDGGSV